MSRVAETCKFPHVTFFLNGMRHSGAPSVEVPSIAEDRIPQQPEMSLAPLTQTICRLMQSPWKKSR